MRFVTDWRECFDVTRELLGQQGPLLLSRIGGSDTNAVAAYLEAREAGAIDNNLALTKHRNIVQRYNGYYDKDNSLDKYLLYLNEMLECYLDAEHLFFCNFQLLSMYFPENIHPQFYASDIEGRRGFELLVSAIESSGHTKMCFPYPFVEKLASHHWSLVNVFSETLQGKKVLVVSPFSESIQANFGNRHKFFKNYVYPDFSL